MQVFTVKFRDLSSKLFELGIGEILRIDQKVHSTHHRCVVPPTSLW